jgi:hypothetical protein
MDDLTRYLRSLVAEPWTDRRRASGDAWFRANSAANASLTSVCEFLRFAATRG